MISISKTAFLSSYLIIPISLVLCLFWPFSTPLSSLPVDPHSILLFSLFFQMPHIVASTISFLDPDYFTFYHSQIRQFFMIFPLLFAVIVSLFAYPLFERSFEVLWAIITLHHALSQQFGLIFVFVPFPRSNPKDSALTLQLTGLWKHCTLFTAVIMNFNIDRSLLVYPFSLIDPLITPIVWFAFSGVSLLTAALFYQFLKVPTARLFSSASLYIICNYCLVLSCFYFSQRSLPFFAILITRIIHDFTAFLVYTTHDANRNAKFFIEPSLSDSSPHEKIQMTNQSINQMPNLLYRYVFRYTIGLRSGHTTFHSLTPIVTLLRVLCLVLAFLWAIPITLGDFASSRIGDYVFLLFTSWHYYSDRFIWKLDAPHRKEIKFA
jgi:hypothetical protein